MKTHFVAKSSNRKTGKISNTYRTQDTCPNSCPLRLSGCYAEMGPMGNSPFKIADKFGADTDAVMERIIEQVPQDGMLRWEVSGDVVLADGVTPDLDYIEATNRVAEARPDIQMIRYTHAWEALDPSVFGYTVNASTESVEGVTRALRAGWEAVMVCPEGDPLLQGETFVEGKRLVQCPAETRDDVTCSSCKLCSKSWDTRPVILFEVHGPRKRLAGEAVMAEREVDTQT